MRRSAIIIAIILAGITFLASESKCQTLDINTAGSDAKESELMDLYFKASLEMPLDSLISWTGMVNAERDNGLFYYSYSLGVKSDRVIALYYKDTEKDIDFFNFKWFYKFKAFSIGYDFLYTDRIYHLVGYGLNYKFITASISALGKIEKFSLNVNPTIKSGDYEWGLYFNVMSVQKVRKQKWGFTMKLHLNN